MSRARVALCAAFSVLIFSGLDPTTVAAHICLGLGFYVGATQWPRRSS